MNSTVSQKREFDLLGHLNIGTYFREAENRRSFLAHGWSERADNALL